MGPSINSFLGSLPLATQRQLNATWAALSPDEREALLTILQGVPSERRLLRLLVSMAAAHVKTAFGHKQRVAIVGPTNVGKSTLYNQFIQEPHAAAAVSPLPGTTRLPQEAEAGLFIIVDTPGADADPASAAFERQCSLEAARAADFLIIMFDASQGIRRNELKVFASLVELGKPYIIVLNKSDLVKRDLTAVTQEAAASLGLKPEQVIPISARDGNNLTPVLMAVAISEPELVAALGSAMPAYRRTLAHRSALTAASLAAVIALAPLPIVDFIPLVTTQAIMVVGISRIYGRPISLSMARELAATFGLGFAGRTLFQELSKLGGVPGWLLSAAIASSTTVVMGHAAAIWFEHGERVKPEALKQMTERFTAMILSSLQGLGRRPSGVVLKARVEQALEALPFTAEGGPEGAQPDVSPATASPR